MSLRKIVLLTSAAVSLATLSSTAFAASDLNKTGWFAGFGAGVSFRAGSSDTKDAGTARNGTVEDIEFDAALAVGGRLGYQFSSALGVFMSYDYVGGNMEWFARFPGTSDRTRYDANAQSHVILANVGYSFDLSSKTTVSAIAGLGLSVNRLSDIEEFSEPTGSKLTDVEGHTKTGFAARGGLEVSHAITEAFELKLGGNVDYYGGFSTGETRTFGPNTQAIGAHEVNNTWGASVMARATYRF